LYPNPTTGEFNIAVCGERYAVGDIEIYDMYGRKQKSRKGNSPPFMEGWQPQADGVVINISHLPSGIYFLRITTSNGIVTKKIIKN
jgi:hypothetical protein